MTLYPQADSEYVEQQLLPNLETPADAASPRLEPVRANLELTIYY